MTILSILIQINGCAQQTMWRIYDPRFYSDFITLVFTWTKLILATFPITRILHTCNKLLFRNVQYNFEQKHWTVIKLIRKFIKVLSIWNQIICKREWLERQSYHIRVCVGMCSMLYLFKHPISCVYTLFFGYGCLWLGYVDGCPNVHIGVMDW